MVESAVAGLDNSVLIDELSFKFRPGANYVQERKSVSFYASGSNSYSPAGTKLIKLVITSEGWLDPSTLRVMFDVNNTAPDLYGGTAGVITTNSHDRILRPLSNGNSFFQRMRILCGGTIVEDISDYNHVAEMFTVLTSKDSKVNADAEGFGFDPFNYKSSVSGGTNRAATILNFPGIHGGTSQTILFTPLSGLLSQNRYIPLRYAPITIELELCKEKTEPFVLNTILPFSVENTSNDWSLSNVQVKCDILILDNELENGYTQLLMSGKPLSLNYSTYIQQYQTILNQQKVRLNVARSLSRLKSVFVSFNNNNLPNSPVYKSFNSFYSPMFEDQIAPIFGDEKEMEFSLQLGAKQYPEAPIRSHAESYYQLKKCMGIAASNVHSFNITGQEYKRRKFIIGIDTETILNASFTGKNTRSGELLNIRFDQKSNTATDWATDMYIVLHSDNVLEIGDTGVRVYD